MYNKNAEYPKRKRYRLPGCDYRKPNSFFVTICTQNRRRLFGHIRNGIMHLNGAGRIADAHWKSLSDHFPHIRLDKHVVMPDHIHGIIDIVDGFHSAERRTRPDGQNNAGPWLATAANDPKPDDDERPRQAAALRINVSEPPIIDTGLSETTGRIPTRPENGSLGMIIGAYKSGVTREINRLHGNAGKTIWQYRFHERIIRTESSRQRIRRYIENNPARWSIDHPNG